MAALLFLGALGVAALVFTVAVVGTLLHVLLRLVLFQLFLLKWIVSALVMLVVGPVLLLVGLALALAFGLVLAVPLLPLVLLGLFVWLLVRATSRPAAVA